VVCSKTKQLQVHHTKYTGYAWEAPDTDLLTLCLDCHESMHNKQAPSTQRHLGVFSLMFSTALLKASKIAYEAMPTLGVLISKVEYENVVRVRTVTIARELGVSVATVDRHMKKLRELNIIEPDAIEEDKQRGITSWRICPFLGWKGSSDKIPHYLKTLPPTHSWHSFNDEVAVEIFKDQTN
jgi:DNA-binding transcriptional ArsR family regulator